MKPYTKEERILNLLENTTSAWSTFSLAVAFRVSNSIMFARLKRMLRKDLLVRSKFSGRENLPTTYYWASYAQMWR